MAKLYECDRCGKHTTEMSRTVVVERRMIFCSIDEPHQLCKECFDTVLEALGGFKMFFKGKRLRKSI